MATPNISSLPINSRRKLAHVIGISDYQENIRLPNAINDATQMGFLIHDNEPKLNLTYHEMRHCMLDFECSVKEDSIVLFYFAMVMEHNGSGADLGTRTINAQKFLHDISERYSFLTVSFLDCCRTYHLHPDDSQKKTRSLTIVCQCGLQIMPTKVGSLVAFACTPGTIADDENKGGCGVYHSKVQDQLFPEYYQGSHEIIKKNSIDLIY
ncbi:hypothetical protein I4U23_004077 [Adineta vaga]|nr:hypothetical protein I4U23_004077 [Adineta vaga]